MMQSLEGQRVKVEDPRQQHVDVEKQCVEGENPPQRNVDLTDQCAQVEDVTQPEDTSVPHPYVQVGEPSHGNVNLDDQCVEVEDITQSDDTSLSHPHVQVGDPPHGNVNLDAQCVDVEDITQSDDTPLCHSLRTNAKHEKSEKAKTDKASFAPDAPAFLDNILNFDFDIPELKVGDVFFDGESGEDPGVNIYTLGWIEVVAKHGSNVYLSPVYAPSPPLIAKHIREMPAAAVVDVFRPNMRTRKGRSLSSKLKGRYCWKWSVCVANKVAALHRWRVQGLLVMNNHNVHGFSNGKRHCLTCHKYKDTYRAKWCRLGFGRSVFDQTDVRQIVEKVSDPEGTHNKKCDKPVFEEDVCLAEEDTCSGIDSKRSIPCSPPPAKRSLCVNDTPEKPVRQSHGDVGATCHRCLFEPATKYEVCSEIDPERLIPCSPPPAKRSSCVDDTPGKLVRRLHGGVDTPTCHRRLFEPAAEQANVTDRPPSRKRARHVGNCNADHSVTRTKRRRDECVDVEEFPMLSMDSIPGKQDVDQDTPRKVRTQHNIN